MLAQDLEKRECGRAGIHQNDGGEIAAQVEAGIAGEAAGTAIVRVDARIGIV